MVHLYMVDNYSAIKRNQLLIHTTTWMDIKGIMLNEKKLIFKGHILCNSAYIAYSNWQNYGD